MPSLKLKDKDGNWIPLPTIKGADGKSAYQQAVAGGYKGTEAEFQAILGSGPWLSDHGPQVLHGNLTLDYAFVRYNGDENPNAGVVISSYRSKDSNGNYDGGPVLSLDVGEEDGGTSSIIRFVSDPEYYSDAANKGYVDSKTLVFSGKTIATTAWVTNTTYSAQGYNWRAAVACAGVTTSHRPDVAFGAADATSGNFAPVADSYAGGVYIYCKTKPTATVTIPSIVCVKGV